MLSVINRMLKTLERDLRNGKGKRGKEKSQI